MESQQEGHNSLQRLLQQNHGAGYLDKNKEKIVGFQTDKPFKRSLQPYGGIRMAKKACGVL